MKEVPVPCPHCAAAETMEQSRRTALGYRTFRAPYAGRLSARKQAGVTAVAYYPGADGEDASGMGRPERPGSVVGNVQAARPAVRRRPARP